MPLECGTYAGGMWQARQYSHASLSLVKYKTMYKWIIGKSRDHCTEDHRGSIYSDM